VVYLPTTFMEENFDAASLPVNCMMIVETNGVVQVKIVEHSPRWTLLL